MQLFCATACFLFTSGTPLQASKLTFGSDSDACYAAFLRSLTETFRGLNSCICALTSNLLKAAVLCYCLFPVHFRHSATSIETHLRFRQRCLLRCVSSFTYGNIQRLEQLHLRSDEFFCRSLFYTTSLPELGLCL